jgi:large subunit ribosomal protein L5
MVEENKMRDIIIESIVLHGSSADPQKLEKLKKLLKLISGQEPTQTLAVKRIPAFKIRPGLHIGYKVTIRKKKAPELLKNLLLGTREIKKKQFNPGFFSFGIKEYIEIPSISYQRDIGIIGFDVAVTLKRKGWRVKERKIKKSHIGKSHMISKEETIKFFTENFKINLI